MDPQQFLVIVPVSHDIYDDSPMMWEILNHVWHAKLAADGGYRAPGPLFMREMVLGEVAGSSLAEYLFSDEGTAAVFRIVGPALPPEAFLPNRTTHPDVIRGIERVTGETYDDETGTWSKP